LGAQRHTRKPENPVFTDTTLSVGWGRSAPVRAATLAHLDLCAMFLGPILQPLVSLSQC